MYAYIDDEDVAFKRNMEQCVRLVPAVIAFSCAHHLESTFYTATFGCDSNCVWRKILCGFQCMLVDILFGGEKKIKEIENDSLNAMVFAIAANWRV